MSRVDEFRKKAREAEAIETTLAILQNLRDALLTETPVFQLIVGKPSDELVGGIRMLNGPCLLGTARSDVEAELIRDKVAGAIIDAMSDKEAELTQELEAL